MFNWLGCETLLPVIHCSEFLFVLPLGARLQCCVGPWSWLWLRLGFWDVKMLGTRILIKTQKKSFVYAFSSLCHRCKRGGDQGLVPLASLWLLRSSRWPPFAIFSWLYTIFIVVLNICFPCLSFFTHTSTQQQTRRKRATATLETMMFETYDPRPASKSFSTIYFMWQSMKLTSVACIGSQHTTGSRCGTDQGSIVEDRHTTELKVVVPGLLEKIQLREVHKNNAFK